MGKSKKHRDHDEAHGNHERWLVSYADMMTLLMVLFIVMFAISAVDQKKFVALKDGMAAGFGQQPSPFIGNRSVLSEEGVSPMSPVRPGADSVEPADGLPCPDRGKAAQAAAAGGANKKSEKELLYAEAKAEVARLQGLRRAIEKALSKEGLLQDVRIRIDDRGLRVSLVSRHIVFEANLADLTTRGKRVLRVIAPVLRRLPNQIEVAGHTNQVNVKPKFYPSDWELSAARAVTVLRHLETQGGVRASHMVAAAYGQEQPLRDPKKPGSQAINKRVDIVVLSTAADDVRRLFGEVVRDSKRAPTSHGPVNIEPTNIAPTKGAPTKGDVTKGAATNETTGGSSDDDNGGGAAH